MHARAVYPVTPSLIDWLNHNLLPVEQHVFDYFESIGELIELLERAETTGRPALKYAAEEALANYNEDNGATLTTQDVLSRTTTYVFTDIGEWVLYCEVPGVLLEHPNLGIYGAMEHDSVNRYQILWNTAHSIAVVYRSPHYDIREVYDHEDQLAYGFGRGGNENDTETYTLPPGIEAAVSFDVAEMPNPEEETRERSALR